MVLAYPIVLEEDDGTVLDTSPDFPELVTFGEDRCEALVRAVAAPEEAVAARRSGNRDVLLPSSGGERVVLPTRTAVKVMLYQGMREQRVCKAELARRLGWHLPQVGRVLDVEHRSRLDRTDAALGAIGKRLVVQAEADRQAISQFCTAGLSGKGDLVSGWREGADPGGRKM